MNGPKVAMVSLGCAKNLVSSEQMLWLLSNMGCRVVPEPSGADVVVVNTCGFIESAKREAIETILEMAALKSAGKLGKILVAGCLVERYRGEVQEELPEVDGLLGCGSFHEIREVLCEALQGKTPVYFGALAEEPLNTPRLVTTPVHTAYLKVAEGCDNRCAYCVIPTLRGPFRSRPMESVVEEARWLAARGAKELILVAQDTTRYGLDLYGERRLPALLDELCRIEPLHWLRLHYLYPDAVDDALIERIAREEKIVKYLDIPLQHISDKLLAAMNRRGTRRDIEALIETLRARIPDLVLRTSLIVGLPGEGEAEFEELCAFLRAARMERAGVFSYSMEEGTPAAEMPDQVPEEVRKRRAEIVTEIQTEIMDDFNAALQGRILTVLTEGYDRYAGCHIGRSWADSPDVDGKVCFTARGRVPEGEMVRVRITGTLEGDLFGKARGV